MDFLAFISSIPKPVQDLLIGTAGNFLGGIAFHIVTNLMNALSYQCRKRLSPEPKQIALAQAMARALYETFGKLTDDPELISHYLNMFQELTAREAVAGELSQLIDPRSESELDISLIKNEFIELEYDPDYLGENFSFEDIINNLAVCFYHAAFDQDELRKYIEFDLLLKMVEKSSEVEINTLRTAEATENMASEVSDIRKLIVNILKGQSPINDFQAEIRKVIERGFADQLCALEEIVGAIQKNGYDIGFNTEGIAEIGGDGTSEDSRIDPYIDDLKSEITLLRRAITGHEPTSAELDALENTYCRYIINWFENLTFQGMMRTARVVSLRLEEVYVELRAVAEVPEAADAFSAEERRLLLGIDASDPRERQELFRQMDVLRRERWAGSLPERKSILESIHDDNQHACVILGDPGSGKTTLLHLLALIYAKGPESVKEKVGDTVSILDRLPIFVPLAAFDEMLQQNPGMTLLEFLPIYYERRRMLPGLGPLFKRSMIAGRALLLLDGLDEVLDETSRKYVTGQVSALINRYSERGVRFVLTSRFVGYREAPLPGNLPHLSVLDFGQPEIELFVRQWAHALEIAMAGGRETPETIRLARKLESDLLEDVASNPGVRRLAANPLMLTMLALMRRQIGRLPHRRIQLYERYINTLIENWIEARSLGERTQSLKSLELHEVESILIPLSLWLQKSKPSGTASRRDIRNELVTIYLTKNGIDTSESTSADRERALEKARRFMKEMRHMAGLVIERGYDAFGFLHLTFQEYFAGRALARLDDESRWNNTEPYLHNPRWREPILLCCGRLGIVETRQKQVTSFVRRILNHPDETEIYLRRNLLLSLSIAADDVDLTPGLMAELDEKVRDCFPTYTYELARQLIRGVGRIAVNGHFVLKDTLARALESSDWRMQSVICEILADFLVLPEAVELVANRLDSDTEEVRKAAVNALSGMVETDDAIRDLIIRRLRDRDREVREAAVKVLADLAGTDEKVFNGIVARLQDDRYYKRGAAIEALTPLVKIKEYLVDHFLPLFYDEDRWIRLNAGKALAEIIVVNDRARKKVVSRIEDESKYAREAAIIALSKLVESDEKAKDLLTKRLDDDNKDVRRAAINSFAIPVMSDTNIRDLLFARLNDAKREFERWDAIDVLGQLIESDKEVYNRLFACFKDESKYIREFTIKAFEKIVDTDPKVCDEIICCLFDNENRVRREAVKTLANVIVKRDVQEGFRKILDVEDWSVRQDLAQVLGDNLESPVAHEWINTCLIQQQTERESADFRAKVLEILADYTAAHNEVRDFAIENLYDKNDRVRVAAVNSLKSLVKSDNEVRSILIQRFHDVDFASYIRSPKAAVIRAIGEIVPSVKDARNLVISSLIKNEFDRRDHDFVAALDVLSMHAGSDIELRTIFIDHLKRIDDFTITGMDFSKHALLNTDDEIRNLLIARYKEMNHNNKIWLLDSIGNLNKFDAQIRNQIFTMLYDSDAKRSAFESLSGLPEIDNDKVELLIQHLTGRDFDAHFGAIQAFSNSIGSYDEARELIMGFVNKNDDNFDSYLRKVAIETLAGIVASDVEVRDQIIARLKDDHEDYDVRIAAVNALSKVWETDAEVRKLTLSCLNDRWIYIRVAALNALSVLVQSDIEVRRTAIGCLDSDWWSVRMAAVVALTHWEQLPASEHWTHVVQWLRVDTYTLHQSDINYDQLNKLKNRLPEMVGKCLPGDPKLQVLLLGWLKEPSIAARLGAIRAFCHWPGGPPSEIMAQIVEAARDKRGLESYPARLTAASYLINHKIDTYSRNAISVCMDALTYGTFPWENLQDDRGYDPNASEKIRKQAVAILTKLEPVRFDNNVYNALLHAMQNDYDPQVRDAAYGALVKMANERDMKLRSVSGKKLA